MRYRDLYALLAADLAYLPASQARNVPENIAQMQPKVLSLPIQRRAISNPLEHDRLRRRTGTIETVLDNKETLYLLNATIGTPPQAFQLHLDTGSSDLWVNANSSALCNQASQPCSPAGSYVANSSSTYQYVGSWFEISYVDGSGAVGDYVTDTFSIGDTKLDHLQFGVGYQSSSKQGILGIGYPANEVQVGRAGMKSYDNLPAALVSAGYISRNVYSLWLNDVEAGSGSILFGGFDTARFTGSLETLPIQSDQNGRSTFLITLTSLQLGQHVVAENQAVAVLLDSGSSLSYLPDDMAQTIFSLVGARYDSSVGAAFVPCSLANDSRTLDFNFTSPKISVGMDELVFELSSTTTTAEQTCLFGISPAGTGTAVLGDTFLRSAYIVYDIDNNQISLAQTKFNTTDSSIQEIPTGTSIPGATVVSNPVKATNVGSGGVNGDAATGNNGSNAASLVGAPTSPYVLALLCMGVGAIAVI